MGNMLIYIKVVFRQLSAEHFGIYVFTLFKNSEAFGDKLFWITQQFVVLQLTYSSDSRRSTIRQISKSNIL